MKFSKDGCNGGDGKFLLGMGERGSQEWGVGFIMEGYEIFKVSLHGWWRGGNPVILLKASFFA